MNEPEEVNEPDKLYPFPRNFKSVEDAADSIIANWRKWEGEAADAARRGQDPEAGAAVMRWHLVQELTKRFLDL